MQGQITHNRCPYTLTPLAELPEVNDEHIFPDAIGGVKDYSVRVSAKANSDLGTLIDAPLMESFLIAGQRYLHGIKSRSGGPKLKFRGTLEGTSTEVDLTFEHDGTVETYVRKPVTMDAAGDRGRITVPEADRDRFVRTFVENHKKKGTTVQLGAEVSLIGKSIRCDLELDQLAIKRALCKIAYAALYEYLGDQFLSDPLVGEWKKLLFATDPDEVRGSRIHGTAFDTDEVLSVMIPQLEPYEHAVAIANFQQRGPVVAVSLFGRGFHSLVTVASETSNYGLSVLEGKIAICDAKAAKTRFLSFEDHFVKTADQLPLA